MAQAKSAYALKVHKLEGKRKKMILVSFQEHKKKIFFRSHTFYPTINFSSLLLRFFVLHESLAPSALKPLLNRPHTLFFSYSIYTAI